jgi:hypothetical protein
MRKLLGRRPDGTFQSQKPDELIRMRLRQRQVLEYQTSTEGTGPHRKPARHSRNA